MNKLNFKRIEALDSETLETISYLLTRDYISKPLVLKTIRLCNMLAIRNKSNIRNDISIVCDEDMYEIINNLFKIDLSYLKVNNLNDDTDMYDYLDNFTDQELVEISKECSNLTYEELSNEIKMMCYAILMDREASGISVLNEEGVVDSSFIASSINKFEELNEKKLIRM